MKRIVTGLLLTFLASPVAAQWQVPSGSIPVGRGPGITGFNTVSGSAGAGAKCLLDTTPPTFGTCPAPSITKDVTSLTGFTDKYWLYNKAGVISEVPPPVIYVTQSPYNATCNGIADDTAAIQAAITALPAQGGVTLAIPNGKTCTFSSVLDFKGKNNFIFTGGGGAFNAASNPTRLTYTGGNITRAMDFRDTVNVTIYGMSILNSTPAMVGKLVDAGGTNPGTTLSFGFKIEESSIQGWTGSGTGAACLNISEAQLVTISRVYFQKCQPAIRGQDIIGQSVVVTIRESQFIGHTGFAVVNCGEAWTFINDTWEPAGDGKGTSFTMNSALPCKDTVFINPWMGDVTVAGGRQIEWAGSGLTITGGRITANAPATNVGVAILAASNAINIQGTVFENLVNGIDFQGFASAGVNIKGVFFNTVTNKFANTGSVTGMALTEGNSPSTSQATAAQLLIGQSAADAAWKTLSGDITNDAAGVTTIGTNRILNSQLSTRTALSVMGRSANSAGNAADIAATAASGQILRESGSVLGFGSINTYSNIFFASQSGPCGNVPQNATSFFGSLCWTPTEANAQFVISKAATLSGLQAKVTAAPAAGQTYIFTVRKNAASTSITCTISNPATTCSDLSNTASVAAADLIDMQVVASATAGAITAVSAALTSAISSP